jgi:hypothetical protein
MNNNIIIFWDFMIILSIVSMVILFSIPYQYIDISIWFYFIAIFCYLMFWGDMLFHAKRKNEYGEMVGVFIIPLFSVLYYFGKARNEKIKEKRYKILFRF